MNASIVLERQARFEEWRDAARSLLSETIAPENTVWSVGAANDLFAEPYALAASPKPLTVPKDFVPFAQTVIQARDPQRFALLYRILWRIKHGDPNLLQIASDIDISAATALAKAVRRDRHKMRAFLRFRKVCEEGRDYYVAWFEPDHYIVDSNAMFFVKRFATMEWVILTPDRCAHWDGKTLSLGEGTQKDLVPPDDAIADYWQTYFESIFNPARLMVKAMTSEMPRKYWKNMPEAATIERLIKSAGMRTEAMIQKQKSN